MVDKLVRCLFVIIAACLVAFILTSLIKVMPFIPGEIATILVIAIWGVVALVVLWYIWVAIRGSVPNPE